MEGHTPVEVLSLAHEEAGLEEEAQVAVDRAVVVDR
jgi:hypothetical protein